MMRTPTNYPPIELDASGVLVANDLVGGYVIDPRDYAEAIARSIPAEISATAIRVEGSPVLYEVRIGSRLAVRLTKDEVISFLDGIIAGVNISRGR